MSNYSITATLSVVPDPRNAGLTGNVVATRWMRRGGNRGGRTEWRVRGHVSLRLTVSLGLYRLCLTLENHASELSKHLSSGEEEGAHKFASKNIGVLFARGQLGVSHDDKKAVVGQRWIARFIRVFTPFRFAGDDYLATLTLKDVDSDKRIYAVEAVKINQDAKSRSTPRGAISEDLNSAPFQDLTSQLANMISYYVGDVKRTHPKFVGRDEMFSIGRTVELLERIVQDFCTKHQVPCIRHQAPEFSIIIPAYTMSRRICKSAWTRSWRRISRTGNAWRWTLRTQCVHGVTP